MVLVSISWGSGGFWGRKFQLLVGLWSPDSFGGESVEKVRS